MGLWEWISKAARGGPRPLAGPGVELDAARLFEAARRDRRTSGWAAGASGANEEIKPALLTLRQRSRDACRNNPWAAKAVSSIATALVGTGINPRSATGDPKLDALVDRAWQDWAQDCESTGALDWAGLQLLAARSLLESGEVLVRRRPRRTEDGLAVPLQLQILESDWLDEGKDGQDGGALNVQGVRFDARGRRVGYWLRASHPGEGLTTFADDSRLLSSSDVAHLFEALRPGQARGVPWLTPVLLALRDVDDYADAERVRKRIEASVAAFISGADEGDDGIGPSAVDSNGDTVETLEPGLLVYLRGAKQVTFNHPQAVGGFSEHMRTELHGIAAGARVPYELLTGDLSQVNYSSIRAGLIDFSRLISSVQGSILVRGLCRPVWQWWTAAAQVAGVLPVGTYPVRWALPIVESLDRQKEADADEKELRIGSATLHDVVSRRTGRTIEEHLAEVARVNAMLEDLGIRFASDVRAGTSADTSAPVDGRPATAGDDTEDEEQTP